MKFLRFNPKTSKMYCIWNVPGSGGRITRMTDIVPLSNWPAFCAMINKPDHYILRSSLTLTDKEVLAGFSCYQIQPGDSLLPSADTLKYTLVQPPTKVATKDYAKRKAAGEVLMNNYSVGQIAVTRRASYSFTGGTAVTGPSFGWYIYNLSALPCAAPTFGQRPGETLQQVAVSIVFDVVTNPNATYDLSPLPVFKEEFLIDTGLVTSVVADCNNGEFDLLTELIELPETLEFVTDMTKKALFISCDAELERRAAKRALPIERFAKWTANHWLKLRYALLPIFYSIADISKVLKDMKQEYAEYRAQKAINDPVPLDLMSGALTVTVEGDCTHRCFIKSRYTPDSIVSAFRRLININLLNSAWEVTTLSFVADWAINVSDFLSAVSGSDGSVDSKCCYSIRDNRTVTLSYTNSDVRPKTTVSFQTYERQVINPSDHIGLTIGLNMNWKRYIDACSLSLKPALSLLRSLK